MSIYWRLAFMHTWVTDWLFEGNETRDSISCKTFIVHRYSLVHSRFSPLLLTLWKKILLCFLSSPLHFMTQMTPDIDLIHSKFHPSSQYAIDMWAMRVCGERWIDASLLACLLTYLFCDFLGRYMCTDEWSSVWCFIRKFIPMIFFIFVVDMMHAAKYF